MSDTKHGWVTPRADGARARCGGPGPCPTCNTEAMHEKMLAGLFGAPATAAVPGPNTTATATATLPASWKPINSAPKDGTPVLLYCPEERWEFLVGEYAFRGWFVHGNEIYGEMCGMDPKPTHWMPLPAAPGTPPASAQDDAKDERPYCYALETRGEHNGIADVLLDVEYNGADSFSHGRNGGFPLYRRPAPAAGDARTAAARDVLAERQRQISAEGWTPEHDDEHTLGEIAGAAGCYAIHASEMQNGALRYPANPYAFWPWDRNWWKPTTPRRDLVKAGAMILAEIERLDRAASQQQEG